MQYTIKNPSTTSEKDICDSYAQAGFKDCSVNFTSNAAVVTVTPVNDVYANLSFDDIESQLEGIGLTCTIK